MKVEKTGRGWKQVTLLLSGQNYETLLQSQEVHVVSLSIYSRLGVQ